MTQHLKRNQQGAALIVGLIILIILTILGLTAMKTSILQEKMSGTNMDQSLAFQAAELTLRDAEAHIYTDLTSNSGFTSACTNGLCLPSTNSTFIWESLSWSASNTITYGAFSGASAISGVAAQPTYIIEVLPDMPPPLGNGVGSKAINTGTPYRVTAIAVGRQPGTKVMLQSVYYKP